MKDEIMCKTCEHLIYDPPFYFCGLEHTENSDADVTDHWKPFNFQPSWCLLKRPEKERNEIIRYLQEE